MYYHAERKMEGLKALLSLAAIVAGLALSNMAASPALHIGSGTGDVVGIWRWVQPGAGGRTLDAASPTLEAPHWRSVGHPTASSRLRFSFGRGRTYVEPTSPMMPVTCA